MGKRIRLNDDEVALLLVILDSELGETSGISFSHRSRLAYQRLVKRLKAKLTDRVQEPKR